MSGSDTTWKRLTDLLARAAGDGSTDNERGNAARAALVAIEKLTEWKRVVELLIAAAEDKTPEADKRAKARAALAVVERLAKEAASVAPVGPVNASASGGVAGGRQETREEIQATLRKAYEAGYVRGVNDAARNIAERLGVPPSAVGASPCAPPEPAGFGRQRSPYGAPFDRQRAPWESPLYDTPGARGRKSGYGGDGTEG